MERIRKHVTSAHLIALLALFVALGGTTYAAIKLPKNSVGAKQIKKNAVRTSKVKNGSLLKKDFRAGQLPRGRRGPQGLPGTNGTNGEQGTFGAITAQENTGVPTDSPTPVDLADGTKKSYNVFCPTGQQAIGGGGRGDDVNSEET